MTGKSLHAVLCFVAVVLFVQPCPAQTNSPFTFHVGAGFTNPVRDSDGRLDTGFNVGAGAGVNFTPYLGALVDFGYNEMGVASAALAAAGVPAGSARLYSLTLNPIVRFNPHGRWDFYLTGGGGYYRRTVEFTQPTVSIITAFDPFWGIFFPAAVPSNLVLGTFTQNKSGLNVGGGISVRLRGDSNAKFFAESRYHHAFTTPVATTYLPVTFGFRW